MASPGGGAVIGIQGIQPERLNAEGESPSALSRGLSVSATHGMPNIPEKRKTRKTVDKEADIRVLRILVGVMIPRVTLRSTPGYEPLASLGHSTFQVVLPVIARRLSE